MKIHQEQHNPEIKTRDKAEFFSPQYFLLMVIPFLLILAIFLLFLPDGVAIYQRPHHFSHRELPDSNPSFSKTPITNRVFLLILDEAHPISFQRLAEKLPDFKLHQLSNKRYITRNCAIRSILTGSIPEIHGVTLTNSPINTNCLDLVELLHNRGLTTCTISHLPLPLLRQARFSFLVDHQRKSNANSQQTKAQLKQNSDRDIRTLQELQNQMQGKNINFVIARLHGQSEVQMTDTDFTVQTLKKFLHTASGSRDVVFITTSSNKALIPLLTNLPIDGTTEITLDDIAPTIARILGTPPLTAATGNSRFDTDQNQKSIFLALTNQLDIPKDWLKSTTNQQNPILAYLNKHQKIRQVKFLLLTIFIHLLTLPLLYFLICHRKHQRLLLLIIALCFFLFFSFSAYQTSSFQQTQVSFFSSQNITSNPQVNSIFNQITYFVFCFLTLLFVGIDFTTQQFTSKDQTPISVPLSLCLLLLLAPAVYTKGFSHLLPILVYPQLQSIIQYHCNYSMLTGLLLATITTTLLHLLFSLIKGTNKKDLSPSS